MGLAVFIANAISARFLKISPGKDECCGRTIFEAVDETCDYQLRYSVSKNRITFRIDSEAHQVQMDAQVRNRQKDEACHSRFVSTCHLRESRRSLLCPGRRPSSCTSMRCRHANNASSTPFFLKPFGSCFTDQMNVISHNKPRFSSLNIQGC